MSSGIFASEKWSGEVLQKHDQISYGFRFKSDLTARVEGIAKWKVEVFESDYKILNCDYVVIEMASVST